MHRGIFSKIDRILGYKIIINKFKVIQIIQSWFYDPKRIRLEENNREIPGISVNLYKEISIIVKNPGTKVAMKTYKYLWDIDNENHKRKPVILTTYVESLKL